MRLLSSYTVSIGLSFFLAFSLLIMTAVDYFSVIGENNIQKISALERNTNFQMLDRKIDSINEQAATIGIKTVSKIEAMDIIIKYADYLLEKYAAKATLDRPEDTGNVLRLRLSFTTEFKSAKEFLDTLNQMLKMTSPIMQVSSLAFMQDGKVEKGNRARYKIRVDGEIVQPYAAEGK